MRPLQYSPTQWKSPDPHRVERRIRAFGSRLAPGHFFSHLTAASLWGLPVPTLGVGEPLHVSVHSPQPRPRANGLMGHELDARVTSVVTIDEYPVTEVSATWCQLASLLSVHDLVAVADAMIMPELEQPPLVTLADLERAVEMRRGHRGAGQLRHALDLARPGSANRIESVLRVMMMQAGLPEPELGAMLSQTDASFSTRVPIAFPCHRVGIDVHFEADRPYRVHSAELERLARLDDMGWRMVAFSDADVHPSRQFELRQKIASIQQLLFQQGTYPGDAA